MQLDALLRSFHTMVREPGPLKILYSASTAEYAHAYSDLREAMSNTNVSFHRQQSATSFRHDTLALLRDVESPATYFLVDDIIIIRPFNLRWLAQFSSTGVIPSMRMGRNITTSYTHNSSQPRPNLYWVKCKERPSASEFDADTKAMLWWRWSSGVIDWGYPYSLDGNIFATCHLQSLVRDAQFLGPNSFEAALVGATADIPRWGVCYSHSRIVNVPVNRVQFEVDNLHGGIHQDQLLALWRQGYRIDISGFADYSNRAVHEEISFNYRREVE